MTYRVSSIYRRMYWIASLTVLGLLVLYELLSNSAPTQPANIALIGILLIWYVFIAVRGWRSATLLAYDDRIKLRGLLRTVSVPWDLIDHFAAETRQVPLPGFPVRVKRSVLILHMRGGGTRWFSELCCRPGRDGSTTWLDTSVVRLNELLAMHPESHGLAQTEQ